VNSLREVKRLITPEQIMWVVVAVVAAISVLKGKSAAKEVAKMTDEYGKLKKEVNKLKKVIEE